MTSARAIRRPLPWRRARRVSGIALVLAGVLLLAADAPLTPRAGAALELAQAEQPAAQAQQPAAEAKPQTAAPEVPAPEVPAPEPNSPAPKQDSAEQPEPAAPAPLARKPGGLVRVPLPIVGNADTQVIAAARRAISEMPPGAERPVLVLEFSSSTGQTGAGSDFERSLKLARFLSSREASAVETVAYIPEALKGHAVLAAMACEGIIMAPEAVIGDAGIDEPAEQATDPTVKSGYREIANRRRTIPPEVALSMLDKSLELLKVETEVSPEYVLADELEALKQKRTITSQKVLKPPGQFALFTGGEARSEGFAKYLAGNRAALAEALAVEERALEDDPSLFGEWRPVRVSLEGPITSSAVTRVQRTIDKQVREAGTNFIVLRIDSPGGTLADSMTLANFLADQDPAEVRIVAYVPGQARSDAAIVALAADQLVVGPDAILGGNGEVEITAEDAELVRATIRDSLALKKQRSWSLPAALIDPSLRVYEYTHRGTGAVAYFSEEEQAQQAEPDQWNQGAEITKPGEPLELSGTKAEQLKLARYVVEDMAGLQQEYGLEGDVALAEPGWADYLIEALATPAVAWMLLLIGGAALYAEIQAPGIGIGAFIAGLCFLLFFWSKYLEGTAGWLEVLLFAAGVCCVLLELFVLPGSAIFGLGGGALIIISLILASQTFVFPHNEYQMTQLRDSLLALLGVGFGITVAAMIMHRYLPHTPLFNNMMLEPPSHAELEDLAHREAIVDFDHLLGLQGTAATQLTPSGKARFEGRLVDVIADGEVIARGDAVVVTEVHGNRVIVRSASETA